MPTKISIPIDAKVLFEMYQYAGYAKHHYKSEIAGWGHYKQDKGIYKLAPLVKQEVTGATAETSSQCIIDDVDYDISDLIVHWHSHVDMIPTPSSTDLQQIRETMELYPMLISIIVNCKNQYSARLDVRTVGGKNGFRLNTAETYDVELIPYYSNNIVSKEVLKKLRKPKPPKPKPLPEIKAIDYNANWWQIRGAEYQPNLFSSRPLIAPSEAKSEIADYIPPKSNKIQDVQSEIEKQDLMDMLTVLNELAKLEGIRKVEINKDKIRRDVYSGAKSPYILSVNMDDPNTIKINYNQQEFDCVMATIKFVEMLKQNGDITITDYERLMTLIN